MKRYFFYFSVFTTLIFISSCTSNDEYADWKIINEAWMNQHKTDAGFTVASSGLVYKIIYAGNGAHINSSSTVTVKYKGQLIDGSVFEEITDTTGTSLNLAYMTSGFAEGVSKLRDGGRIIMYIPESLGYGSNGSGDAIPPHSALIFDVEVLDVIND